ncbi:hypothetical protein [Hoeflea halophila]|nr:hypothetical protein [Hoeflea halophila]
MPSALVALSDPDMQDRNALNVINALAIKHRLGGGAVCGTSLI